MKNKLMLEDNLKNELTDIQKELVEKAFKNISSILDMKKISNWVKDNKIYSIMVFGSRTRLHETQSSDLDILITDCEALDSVNDDNYLYRQKEIVDSLYESFVENILINKDVELDFKLNINRFEMDCYNGLNAKEPVSEDNDFYFEYIDIPSYFEINKDSVKFVVEDSLEIDEVFEDNSFKKLDIF